MRCTDGIVAFLRYHEAYKNVRDERDRKSVLDDVAYLKGQHLKEVTQAARNKKHQVIALVFPTLPEMSAQTRWSDFIDDFRDSEMVKADEVLRELENAEIFDVFEKWMLAAEATEAKALRVVRDGAKRKLRKARDAYVEMLSKMCTDGDIVISSKWKDCREKIFENAAYVNLSALTSRESGSTPLDLFKLRVGEIKGELDRDKRKLQDMMRESSFEVTVR